jgi:hypothetical protein
MGIEDYQVKKLDNDNVIQLSDWFEKANIDAQVATAKQYPRDIQKCVNNSIAIATMDYETAKSMGYALPRGGKPITGPSVHLAKLVVSNWGNMRTEAKVVQVTDKEVVSRGIAWDLESNTASSFEVRRKIIGKSGQRFNDDMITVTGNAANAIAYRNAVFAVVPKGIVEKIYRAAQEYITGDLSDETKLIKKRKAIVDGFNINYGITEEEVAKLAGKAKIEAVKAEQIATLIGIAQSLKDGDTSVDDLMKNIRQAETKSNIAEEAEKASIKKYSKKQNDDLFDEKSNK